MSKTTKKLFSFTLALMFVLSLWSVTAFAGNTKILEGDANVDSRNYPSVIPFVHPPFYNAKLSVTVDEGGKIIEVKDNGTGLLGSVATKEEEEIWEKKNLPYWDVAIKSGILDRMAGKTADDVRAMKMGSGEADAVSGATMCGEAIQEAILNAFEGRSGKLFLPVEGCALPYVETKNNTLVFDNKLPADFVVKFVDVRYGIYNAEEDILPADSYQFEMKDGKATLTFKDISALKGGKYYINLEDESGKYRAPHFESGHGDTDMAQAPRFIITSDAKVSISDLQVILDGAEITDYMKNIAHVIIKTGDQDPVEQELVGHHGTVNKRFNVLSAQAALNPEGTSYNRKDKVEVPLFESGKTYNITISAFGFQDLTVEYIAK